MAKPAANLSESIMRRRPPRPSSQVHCSLLFSQSGTSQPHWSVSFHAHRFWQAELVTSGPVGVWLDGTWRELSSGRLLLIPPRARHAFRYELGDRTWHSLKFHVDRSPPAPAPALCPAGGPAGAIAKALARVLAAPQTPATAQAVEHLLAGVVACIYADNEDAPADDHDLVHDIEAAVASRQGRRTSVADVARQLGYSASHVSAQWRLRRGEALKALIDRSRAREAVRLLTYSDLGAKQIARLLEFPDLFSFSRFVKRLTGLGPREHRRPAPPQHQAELYPD